MNCILPDDYCKSGNTMECARECTNSLDFFCPPELVEIYCAEDQFACINECNVFLNICIPKEKKCNGNPECPNGKDEEGCVDTCNAEEVQCIHENGKKLPLNCILPAKHCDGISDCQSNGEDEMGCFPWWIWLIIALVVLLIVVFITVCICKRKRGKFVPHQEKNTQTEIEAPTIITQTEIKAPTMTSKDKEREILFKPDKQTVATPNVHEDPKNTTLPIITIQETLETVILPPSTTPKVAEDLENTTLPIINIPEKVFLPASSGSSSTRELSSSSSEASVRMQIL